MIRRVLGARLRLVDAVALAAVAVLGLKLAAYLKAPQVRPAPSALGVVSAEEQLPAFGRVIANARTNYVPPMS